MRFGVIKPRSTALRNVLVWIPPRYLAAGRSFKPPTSSGVLVTRCCFFRFCRFFAALARACFCCERSIIPRNCFSTCSFISEIPFILVVKVGGGCLNRRCYRPTPQSERTHLGSLLASCISLCRLRARLNESLRLL